MYRILIFLALCISSFSSFSNVVDSRGRQYSSMEAALTAYLDLCEGPVRGLYIGYPTGRVSGSTLIMKLYKYKDSECEQVWTGGNKYSTIKFTDSCSPMAGERLGFMIFPIGTTKVTAVCQNSCRGELSSTAAWVQSGTENDPRPFGLYNYTGKSCTGSEGSGGSGSGGDGSGSGGNGSGSGGDGSGGDGSGSGGDGSGSGGDGSGSGGDGSGSGGDGSGSGGDGSGSGGDGSGSGGDGSGSGGDGSGSGGDGSGSGGDGSGSGGDGSGSGGDGSGSGGDGSGSGGSGSGSGGSGSGSGGSGSGSGGSGSGSGGSGSGSGGSGSGSGGSGSGSGGSGSGSGGSGSGSGGSGSGSGGSGSGSGGSGSGSGGGDSDGEGLTKGDIKDAIEEALGKSGTFTSPANGEGYGSGTALTGSVAALQTEVEELEDELKRKLKKSPLKLGQMSFSNGSYDGTSFNLSRWDVDVGFNLFSSLGVNNTDMIRTVILFIATLFAGFILLSSGRSKV